MGIYLLQHLLKSSAGKYPERDAVIFNNHSITYSRLDLESDQLAVALIHLGVKPGDRVGLMMKKSIESITCIFGVLKSGASYVPIDPVAPSDRIKYIINECGIECLIITGKSGYKIIPDMDYDLPLKNVIVTEEDTERLTERCENLKILTWENILNVKTGDLQEPHIIDSDPAYILYTSGSTGVPKGVVISHLNALTFVNMTADFFKIDEHDRLCCHAPFYSDLTVFDIFVAVRNGAAIVLIPEFLSSFPARLAHYILQKDITVWNSVSTALILLSNYDGIDKFHFDSLRIIIFSGELFPVKYLRKLKKQAGNATFFNLYGQTEANSSMYYEINGIPDDDSWKIPIGRPFPNFEVFLINGGHEISSTPDIEGELYVKSSSVAIGYWNNRQMTDEKFIADPRNTSNKSRVYKSGDIVRIDKEGNYIFIGRKDRVVKSRGYRIELDEIEITLNNYPLIHQAAAVNMPDELIGNKVIAYVSAVKDRNLEIDDIIDHCSKSLPRYMIPEFIEILDSLPTTPNGKIDRKSLKNNSIQNTIVVADNTVLK